MEEAVVKRRIELPRLRLHPPEQRHLFSLSRDIDRGRSAGSVYYQERDVPAPSRRNTFYVHLRAAEADHEELRRSPGSLVWIQLRGDSCGRYAARASATVGRRPAVLAAEREALDQAQGDHEDGASQPTA